MIPRSIRAGLHGLTMTFLAAAMPFSGKADMLAKMAGTHRESTPVKKPYSDPCHKTASKFKTKRRKVKARHMAGPL